MLETVIIHGELETALQDRGEGPRIMRKNDAYSSLKLKLLVINEYIKQ